MSHFDKLVRLPEGFVVIASTNNSQYAGIAHESKHIFGTTGQDLDLFQANLSPGVQFHPELEHVSQHVQPCRQG